MIKFFSLFFIVVSLYSDTIVVVYKHNIIPNQNFTKEDFIYKEVSKIKFSCKPYFSIKKILDLNYISKAHKRRGEVVCSKDFRKAKKKDRILFNFGSIEIEKDGKIIKETKDRVRIQNSNGKFETIYKDGR